MEDGTQSAQRGVRRGVGEKKGGRERGEEERMEEREGGKMLNCGVLAERHAALAAHFERSRVVGREQAGNARAVLMHRCATCGYSSPNRSNLLYHVLSKHLQLLPFACGECDAKSCSYTNLTHHYQRVHEIRLSDPDVAFRCAACSAPYSAPLELLDHYLDAHHKAQSAQPACAIDDTNHAGVKNIGNDATMLNPAGRLKRTPDKAQRAPSPVALRPVARNLTEVVRSPVAQHDVAHSETQRSLDGPSDRRALKAEAASAHNAVGTNFRAAQAVRGNSSSDQRYSGVKRRMQISNLLQ